MWDLFNQTRTRFTRRLITLAPPQSAIERVMKVTDHSDNVEQIVVTTRMRKGVRGDASNSGAADERGSSKTTAKSWTLQARGFDLHTWY